MYQAQWSLAVAELQNAGPAWPVLSVLARQAELQAVGPAWPELSVLARQAELQAAGPAGPELSVLARQAELQAAGPAGPVLSALARQAGPGLHLSAAAAGGAEADSVHWLPACLRESCLLWASAAGRQPAQQRCWAQKWQPGLQAHAHSGSETWLLRPG